MHNLALVQYIFDREEKDVKVIPHGNNKSQRPFHRTSDSTREEIKKLAPSLPSKAAFYASLEESGGVLSMKSAATHTRDIKQIKNIKSNIRGEKLTIT